MTAQSKTPKDSVGTNPTVAAPMTTLRLEAAIVYLAQCVVTRGPSFAPFMDKLEDDLAAMREGSDPLSRARAIVAAAKASREA